MEQVIQTAQISNAALWAGRIMSALAVVLLFLDGATKLVKPGFVVAATTKLGYPESTIVGIGIALLVATVLYLVPSTSILGAILLTGYLGGAVASHVRVDNPLFTHTLFPVYVALLIWGGLYLRDLSLRSLVPLHQ